MSNEVNALWYVVHTYSGYENKVATNIEKIVENRGLGHLILETKIPLEVVTETAEEKDEYLSSKDDYSDDEEKGEAKRKKNAEPERHKLFPSYVLVRMVMNDETWHVIRNVRGVTGFVGPGSKPVPLSDEEVAALGVECRVASIAFEAGDSVMIVAGHLAGSVATVSSIDETTRRIKALVMFGGRETTVELDASDVEKMN